VLIDLVDTIARWADTMDEDTRGTCLATPEIFEDYAQPGYVDFLGKIINDAVSAVPEDARSRTVFAVCGLMELFDFVHVSEVVEGIDRELTGILTVFFPGEREDNVYRFLGARDGWDYLAVPILADSSS
jgi:hypothetical protein